MKNEEIIKKIEQEKKELNHLKVQLYLNKEKNKQKIKSKKKEIARDWTKLNLRVSK